MEYTIDDFPIETNNPKIDVTLPVGMHVLELVVEDDTGQKSAPDTVVITVVKEEASEPKITDIDPQEGFAGTSRAVTISGENLGETTAVTFEEESHIVADIDDVSEDWVKVTLAIGEEAEEGTYDFDLIIGGEVCPSGDVEFKVKVVEVDGINPNLIKVDPNTTTATNTTVTISGKNLSETTRVTFQAESLITTGEPRIVDDNVEVDLTIPGPPVFGTYTFELTIGADNWPSGDVEFTVQPQAVPEPNITGISPNRGKVGTTIENAEIYGNNLWQVEDVAFFYYKQFPGQWEWNRDITFQKTGETGTVLEGTIVIEGTVLGDHRYYVRIGGSVYESPPRDNFFTVEPFRPGVDRVSGIGPVYTQRLAESGITRLDELAAAEPARVAEVLGVSEERAAGFIAEAKRLLEG